MAKNRKSGLTLGQWRSDEMTASRTTDLFGQGLSKQGKANRKAAQKLLNEKAHKKTSRNKKALNQK